MSDGNDVERNREHESDLEPQDEETAQEREAREAHVVAHRTLSDRRVPRRHCETGDEIIEPACLNDTEDSVLNTDPDPHLPEPDEELSDPDGDVVPAQHYADAPNAGPVGIIHDPATGQGDCRELEIGEIGGPRCPCGRPEGWVGDPDAACPSDHPEGDEPVGAPESPSTGIDPAQVREAADAAVRAARSEASELRGGSGESPVLSSRHRMIIASVIQENIEISGHELYRRILAALEDELIVEPRRVAVDVGAEVRIQELEEAIEAHGAEVTRLQLDLRNADRKSRDMEQAAVAAGVNRAELMGRIETACATSRKHAVEVTRLESKVETLMVQRTGFRDQVRELGVQVATETAKREGREEYWAELVQGLRGQLEEAQSYGSEVQGQFNAAIQIGTAQKERLEAVSAEIERLKAQERVLLDLQRRNREWGYVPEEQIKTMEAQVLDLGARLATAEQLHSDQVDTLAVRDDQIRDLERRLETDLRKWGPAEAKVRELHTNLASAEKQLEHQRSTIHSQAEANTGLYTQIRELKAQLARQPHESNRKKIRTQAITIQAKDKELKRCRQKILDLERALEIARGRLKTQAQNLGDAYNELRRIKGMKPGVGAVAAADALLASGQGVWDRQSREYQDRIMELETEIGRLEVCIGALTTTDQVARIQELEQALETANSWVAGMLQAGPDTAPDTAKRVQAQRIRQLERECRTLHSVLDAHSKDLVQEAGQLKECARRVCTYRTRGGMTPMGAVPGDSKLNEIELEAAAANDGDDD